VKNVIIHKAEKQKSMGKHSYYGAGDRIKRQLSYRLGAVMIKHSKSVTGWIKMPWALIKETKKFSKDLEKVKHRKLPSISSYKDSYEAEQVKQHLSYRLGYTVIKNRYSVIGWIKLPWLLRQEIIHFQQRVDSEKSSKKPKNYKNKLTKSFHFKKSTSSKVISGVKNKNDLIPLKEKREWDTRLCLSVTSVDKNIILPKKIYIVPVILGELNTTRYRVYHLIEACSGIVDIEVIDYKNVPNNFFLNLNKHQNIVVIQRLAIFDEVTEEFMNSLRRTPSLIIYEIDDQIFDAVELDEWRVKGLNHPPKQYFHCMKYADQYIVSTKELRKKVESLFYRPVHILQNLINEKMINLSLKEPIVLKQKKLFIIGYASGSSTHDMDLMSALAGVDKFLSEVNTAKFHCIGNVNLPDDFLKKHKEKVVITNKVSWKKLPSLLASFTIQIIPLEICNFNKYKSHIRFLESSAVSIPVLGSTIGEQSETIIHKQTGYLCDNTEDDWYCGLSWYYKNPQKLHKIGTQAKNYILEYWTTKSRFRKWRIENVLQDFTLGMMRDKISIILVIYNPLYDIEKICESIKNNTNVPFELLIWVNSNDKSTKKYINSLNMNNTYIVDIKKNVGKSIAANYLFNLSLERFVVGLDDDYILPEYWAEKMIHATKATPKLGWLSSNLTEDSSGIRGRGNIASYYGGVSIYLPSGVGGWMVFTTASAREKIGFYREHGLYGGIDGDFNRRARSLGLTTGYVRNVVGKHKTQRYDSLAWELFKQRIQDEMRIHGKNSDDVVDKFTDFFSERTQSFTCSIKISTSITHDENVWGDTHYAIGLKRALEKMDYEVRIDKHEEWYDKFKDDIVIHLFGLHKYEPNPYSLNILWIISHIDKINRSFLLGFDYIFCASDKVTSSVRMLVPEIKSETLLQCTDTETFYSDSDIIKDIDISFIGNSRRIYRKSIEYSVKNDFNISIWGTKWEQFIDKCYIKGQSLPSAEVADIYRRSKIVLNDHWDDQIEFELVNNRIFDVLACGTVVLSDFNAGVNNIFKNDMLPMFSDEKNFTVKLRAILDDDGFRKKISNELGQEVIKYHTFTQRAEKINHAVSFLIKNYVEYKSEMLYKIRKFD